MSWQSRMWQIFKIPCRVSAIPINWHHSTSWSPVDSFLSYSHHGSPNQSIAAIVEVAWEDLNMTVSILTTGWSQFWHTKDTWYLCQENDAKGNFGKVSAPMFNLTGPSPLGNIGNLRNFLEAKLSWFTVVCVAWWTHHVSLTAYSRWTSISSVYIQKYM